MMTKNFFYFENIRVSETRSGLYYKVELEEEDATILVKKDLVEEITPYEQEELIAILLACMEYSRRCRNHTREAKAPKPNENQLVKCIIELLTFYPMENLIEIIRDLKWSEISDILNANNPIKAMQKII